jgi:hypothetical protein
MAEFCASQTIGLHSVLASLIGAGLHGKGDPYWPGLAIAVYKNRHSKTGLTLVDQLCLLPVRMSFAPSSQKETP